MSRHRGADPLELPARSHRDHLVLLAEVDAVLAETTEENTAYVLYTVGGFVMGRNSESRLTQHIDAATTIPAPVGVAATEVAARHAMNPAWLNDQVSKMIQASVCVDRFVEIYRGRHLLVYGADDELMLALKLMSGRDRDIGDIVHLARQTRRTTPEALLDAWDRVYNSAPDAAPQRHLVNSVIQDDVMPALRRHSAAERSRSPTPNNKRPTTCGPVCTAGPIPVSSTASELPSLPGDTATR